jgi:hypothetical protein
MQDADPMLPTLKRVTDVIIHIRRAELVQRPGGSLFAAAHWRSGADEATWPLDRTPTAWMSGRTPVWDHQCPRHPYVLETRAGRDDSIVIQVFESRYGGLGKPTEVGRTAALPIKELLGDLLSSDGVPEGDRWASEREFSLRMLDQAVGHVTVQVLLRGSSEVYQLENAPETSSSTAKNKPKSSSPSKSSNNAARPASPKKSSGSPGTSAGTGLFPVAPRSPWKEVGQKLSTEPTFDGYSDSEKENEDHPKKSMELQTGLPTEDEALAVLQFVKDQRSKPIAETVPRLRMRHPAAGRRRRSGS